MTQAFKPDPYADLGEVYAEETSLARIRVQPTAKTPTDSPGVTEGDEVPEVSLLDGFHIDGDKRFQER